LGRDSDQGTHPAPRRPGAAPAETEAGIHASIEAQAMRWLARREYSVHELEQRLAGKGFPSGEISTVLDGLIGQGLVSDTRFTETLVRNRVERGYGPLKIAYELRAKGIDDALVDEFLQDEEEYWVERLRAVWERRFGRPPADYREWTRQARGLQSRGFTAQQVRRVIPDIES
jgi:regulatory protein